MRSIHWKNVFSSTALGVVLVAANLSIVSCERGSDNNITPSPVGVGPPPAPPPAPPPPKPVPPPPKPLPPPPPVTSPPPVTTTWQNGVFRPMKDFENRCVHPRTGQDPDNDQNPYPDKAGTMLDEQFWLRSWTHKTYLWNREVVDANPNTFTKPKTDFAKHETDMETYFNTLKTTARTNSGKYKDEFHFMQTTEEYVDASRSEPSPSYGITWHSPKNNLSSINNFVNRMPRDVRVRYVIPESPASKLTGSTIKRGDQVLAIDDVDFLRGGTVSRSDDQNTLIRGLLRPSIGKSTKFLLKDVDTGEQKTVTVQAANVVPKPVNNTSIITADDGKKVGYINFTTFNTFSSEKAINDAIGEMKNANVSDLVLDLRYNGGGFVFIAAQVGYMLSGIATPLDTDPKPYTYFIKFRYNSDAGSINPTDGRPIQHVPFVDFCLGKESLIDPCDPSNPAKLNTLDLKRVYILSTEGTCSASEAVINGLRGANIEVILIGEKTCGKPYGFLPTDNCGLTYYTIQFQIRNNKDFGDYADGLMPSNTTAHKHGVKVKGCYVKDDFTKPLGDETEALLAAALQYRKDGTCPALPSPPSPPPPSPSATLVNAEKLVASINIQGRSVPYLKPTIDFPREKWNENNLDITVPASVQEYLDKLAKNDD